MYFKHNKDTYIACYLKNLEVFSSLVGRYVCRFWIHLLASLDTIYFSEETS
jgi:hypothetical protein